MKGYYKSDFFFLMSHPRSDSLLTLSQTIRGFYVSAIYKTSETPWEKEKLLVTSNFFPFPTVFSIHFENFMPFSSNSKLSSANSYSLEQSKICRLGKGQ